MKMRVELEKQYNIILTTEVSLNVFLTDILINEIIMVMKELSIEQKAKAYDAALEYAHCLIEQCKEGTCGSFHRADLDKMFPELAESEDERIRKEIIELVMQPTWKTEKEFNRRNELCEWLEKQGKTSPVFSNSSNIGKVEQKPAWSEEDDNCLSTIIAEFSKCSGKSVSKDEWFRCNDFLNSLKDRHTWKPSDEQIVALKHASNDCSIAFADMKILATLYEQLKALHHYGQDT